jgi:predicted nucleic acid-binding protein
LTATLFQKSSKGEAPQVEQHKIVYVAQFSKLTFTSATLLEILYGYERVRAHAQIKRAETLFAANDEIIPASEDYRLAATIAGALDRNGTTIGLIDPLIAACAVRRGYGVASGNTGHYEFIRKLGYTFHLENWRDA